MFKAKKDILLVGGPHKGVIDRVYATAVFCIVKEERYQSTGRVQKGQGSYEDQEFHVFKHVGKHSDWLENKAENKG